MRRRFALVLLLLAFGSYLAPSAYGQESTPPPTAGGPPSYTPLGSDGLSLYGFTFAQFNEIPWFQYDATMTVYVLTGSFAFNGQPPDGTTIIIDPPRGSTCLEIREGQKVEENGQTLFEYPEVEEPNKQCLMTSGGAPCLRRCGYPQAQDQPLAVILEPGSVLYLPKGTICFVCAIAATGASELDITVLTEEANASWISAAVLNEVPPNSPEQQGQNANPGSFRLLNIPARNPGGCAGKTG
jgi:hypothetical protein